MKRLGRKPRTYRSSIPHMSALMAGRQLPPAPISCDYAKDMPADFGMMGNDRLGDCFPGDVSVAGGNTNRVYRGWYDGPLLVITTKSGKKLPVTPNHAMLTERGFARACTLQKGDNLVSTSRPDVFPGATILGGKTNINQPPSTFEEIFSTFSLGRGAIRKVMPISIDFHGDEQFINGNVEIVGADSLLWSESDSALRQPRAKNKIGPARKLQSHFISLGSAFLTGIRSLPSPFCDVGFSSNGAAFGYAHASVSQSYGLSHVSQGMTGSRNRHFNASTADTRFNRKLLDRLSSHISFNQFRQIPVLSPRQKSRGLRFSPHLRASVSQPSAQRHFTDAGLSRKLSEAFPGIITADSIVDIEFQRFHGHIYDMSTTSRMYSANGILAHNCTIAAYYHARQIWSFNAGGTEITNPDADVLALYEKACSYNPADPTTDQGGVEQDVLTYLLNTGAPGCEPIIAFVEADPRNLDDMKRVIYDTSCAYIGVDLPESAMSSDVWGVQSNDPIAGGHAIILCGYDLDGFDLISWGKRYRCTNGFISQYCEEAYAIADPLWIAKTGKTPLGMTVTELEFSMAALKNAA